MPELRPTLSPKAYKRAYKLLLSRGFSPEEAKKKLKKPVFTYVVTIRKIGSAAAQGEAVVMRVEVSALKSSSQYRSKRNRVSVRNLPPGNYQTDYTGQISTPGKPSIVLGNTKPSAPTRFSVGG